MWGYLYNPVASPSHRWSNVNGSTITRPKGSPCAVPGPAQFCQPVTFAERHLFEKRCKPLLPNLIWVLYQGIPFPSNIPAVKSCSSGWTGRRTSLDRLYPWLFVWAINREIVQFFTELRSVIQDKAVTAQYITVKNSTLLYVYKRYNPEDWHSR